MYIIFASIHVNNLAAIPRQVTRKSSAMVKHQRILKTTVKASKSNAAPFYCSSTF